MFQHVMLSVGDNFADCRMIFNIKLTLCIEVIIIVILMTELSNLLANQIWVNDSSSLDCSSWHRRCQP